jgi:hypothetical protein
MSRMTRVELRNQIRSSETGVDVEAAVAQALQRLEAAADLLRRLFVQRFDVGDICRAKLRFVGAHHGGRRWAALALLIAQFVQLAANLRARCRKD